MCPVAAPLVSGLQSAALRKHLTRRRQGPQTRV